VPTLACSNFEELFILQTNASSVGLGAVLTEIIEGEKRMIAIASRSSRSRKEILGYKNVLLLSEQYKNLDHILERYRFTVVTNHSSLH